MKVRPEDLKLISLLLRSNRRQSNGGYVLIVAIMLSVVLLGLLTAYALTTKTETTSSTASTDSTSGLYAAESGLNIRAQELMNGFANAALPTGTSPTSLGACLDATTGNDGTGAFRCINYQLAGSGPGRSGRVATTYAVDTTTYVGGQAPTIAVPPGELYAGMTVQEYSYQLYSIAQKQAANAQTEAILQLNVKARILPLFQFAAFYNNDLEMNSSPKLTLNGRVHTNASFFFVGSYNVEDTNNPSRINGQTTVACPTTTSPANPRCPTSGTFANGGLYNTLKNNSSYNNGNGMAQVMNADNVTWINLKGQGGNPTGSPFQIIATTINTATGGRVRVGSAFGVQPIDVPPPSALGTTGDYYNKADIRIQYRPGLTVPFEVRRVNSASLTLPRPNAEVFALPGQTNGSEKGAGVLRSLRQPVLADVGLSAAPSGNQYRVCPSAPPAAPSITSLPSPSTDQSNAIIRALQVAIASQNNPVQFSNLSQPVNALTGANSIDNSLNGSTGGTFNSNNATNGLIDRMILTNSAFSTFTTTTSRNNLKTDLRNLSPVQMAALRGRCFVPPALQEILDFRNDREVRLIDMVQINLAGMAVWNRDGIYVEFDNSNAVSNNNSDQGFSADGLLFARAAADTSAPQYTFQYHGYAASDQTDGGIVIHATINSTDYPYTAAQSPYAFALTGGKQLFGLARTTNTPEPSGMTVVSDQAIYVQGNYNSTRTLPANYDNPGAEPSAVKQPAAIMADSLNVLSNICISPDTYRIQKFANNPATGTAYNGRDRLNCNVNPGNNAKVNLSNTSNAFTAINSAFLAATDETFTNDGNGGLNNFPRTHEDWGETYTDVPLFIRGSFVSLNYPVNVSGRLKGSAGIAQNDIFWPPIRLWDYDQDFNLASNLPPLTPTVRSLSQQVYVRQFGQ